MDPLAPIRTREEFVRASAAYRAQQDAALKEGRAQGLTDVETIDRIAPQLYPAWSQLMDIGNPVIYAIVREGTVQMRKENAAFLVTLSDDEQAFLQRTLAEQVAQFNRLFGVDYPVPEIIARTNMGGSKGNMRMSHRFASDTIEMNPKMLRLIQDAPDAFAAFLSHELGHRYLRDRDSMMHTLKESLAFEAHLPESDYPTAWLEAARSLEVHSDYLSAKVNGATGMRKAMELSRPAVEDPLQEHDQELRIYYQMQQGLTYDEAYARYRWNNDTDYQHLSAKQRSCLLDTMAKANPDEDYARESHPTHDQRIRMLEVLERHPELFRASAIRFDGQAHITHVEEHGKAYDPPRLAHQCPGSPRH